MKKCPECSGKVPEDYTECPFCGCLLDAYYAEEPVEESAEESEEELPPSKKEKEDKEKSYGLKQLFMEIFLFVLALLVIGAVVIATDFKGARTELRRMCMMDSGDGSSSDSQSTRIQVKHYILVVLDLFDHGGTGASVRINPNAFQARQEKDTQPLPEKKPEQPPAAEKVDDLPPSPPQLENVEEKESPEKESSTAPAENPPANPPANPPEKKPVTESDSAS